MTTDANSMLMGGGVPSARFDQIGATITGTIAVAPEVQQQRDFTTGEALTWDDGSPRQQIKVVLDTDQRDASDPFDEGQRALYVKSGLMKAVRQAVRAAGAKGLEVGGKLTVRYVADGEPSRRGLNPPKQYTAVYEAPAAPGLVDANALLNSGQQAAPAPAPAPAQQPQPAPAAPAAPAGLSAEQAAALAALTPEQRAALGLA